MAVLRAGLLALAAAAALFAYAPSAGYGLLADDYQWLAGAQTFDAGQLFRLEGREHFFRPVMELYFPSAYALCGRSAACYHWLNIAVHLLNTLLVAGLAGSIARNRLAGAFAGLLFAVQPAPTEAVVWISAITELLSATFVVATLWLLHRGRAWLAAMAFVAAMMAHETGIVALPLAFAMLWLLPRDGDRPRAAWRALAPLAVAAAAYLPIVYIVNSRNYVFAEGHYAIGLHMAVNVGDALTKFAAAGDVAGGALAGAAILVAAFALGNARMKFFVVWIVMSLLPFAGFRDGMAPRYLYLASAGFAGLVAEALIGTLHAMRHRRYAGAALGVIAVLVFARSAVFTSKNVRPWKDSAKPFEDYIAAVRAAHPSPAPGSTLDVPRPSGFDAHYVPTVVQWHYGDPTLRVRMPE